MRATRTLVLVAAVLVCAASAVAETCQSAADMEPVMRDSLDNAGKAYFRMAASGDYASLRGAMAPSLASAFGSVESAIGERKADLAAGQVTVRSMYLLDAPGSAPIQRAEFFCGVFGTTGHTANSASFVVSNLAPGRYALVVDEIRGGKTPLTMSLVLQQQGTSWKLGGFYLKPATIGGHDGDWFLARAREAKSRGAAHNAWFYYLTAWQLLAPVDFMSTLQLDRVSEEMQGARPADLPSRDKPLDLSSSGRSYRVSDMFTVPVGDELALVVKYQVPSIADRQQVFTDNTNVIRGVVARYPEFRQAFTSVVARAVEPSGNDYGTLLAMKDVK